MRFITLMAILVCAMMFAGLEQVQAAQNRVLLASAGSDGAVVKDAVPPAKKKLKRKCLRFGDRGVCRRWQERRCVERRPVCVKKNQYGNCIKYASRCVKWEGRKCLEWAKKPRCLKWADE
jgi:hypothetical protein